MTKTSQKTATPEQIERAERALPSNMQLTGAGKLAQVAALVRQWFPSEELEVVEIGRCDAGYLIFKLVATFGIGEHATVYAHQFNWKQVSESRLGEAIGILQHAHEMKTLCERWIAKASEEIESWNGAQTLERCKSEARRDAWKQALNAVPLMGWDRVAE